MIAYIYHLIASIGAVYIAIATPPRRNAMPIGAREVSSRLTSRRRTLGLVAVVAAVVVAIAHPPLLYALAIPACELVGATRLIWLCEF